MNTTISAYRAMSLLDIEGSEKLKHISMRYRLDELLEGSNIQKSRIINMMRQAMWEGMCIVHPEWGVHNNSDN